MNNNTTPRIAQVGRSFAIVAGKSKLAQFRTHGEAVRYWSNNTAFLAYWAASIGVSFENTAPVTVCL